MNAATSRDKQNNDEVVIEDVENPLDSNYANNTEEALLESEQKAGSFDTKSNNSRVGSAHS